MRFSRIARSSQGSRRQSRPAVALRYTSTGSVTHTAVWVAERSSAYAETLWSLERQLM